MNIGFRPKLVAATQTIKLPREVVEEMYRTSARFAELFETLEILLDKDTLRRLRREETQYRRKQYIVAKGPRGIRNVLST